MLQFLTCQKHGSAAAHGGRPLAFRRRHLFLLRLRLEAEAKPLKWVIRLTVSRRLTAMCGGEAALHARASDRKTRPDTRYQGRVVDLRIDPVAIAPGADS